MAEQSELILGVAGNFAGHLEQAGEARDFAGLASAANRPQGMFPIYVPGWDHRLGVWPCSSDKLVLPAEEVNVQPEPEIVVRCRVSYDDDEPRRVRQLKPYGFAAADDTSLRRPASKIHEKKNWGPHSKGLSSQWIAIDDFGPQGVMRHFRLASFLLRGGQTHLYGEDSALSDYTTKDQELVDWMVDCLRHQIEEGPLDDLSAMVARASFPDQAFVFVGSTRYTPFGESTFVQVDDEVVIVAYDARLTDLLAVRDAVTHHTPLSNASVLRRRVLSASSVPRRKA